MSFPLLPPRFPSEQIRTSAHKVMRSHPEGKRSALIPHCHSTTSSFHSKNHFSAKKMGSWGKPGRRLCKWRAGSFRLCIPEVNVWSFPLPRGISKPKLGLQTGIAPAGFGPCEVLHMGPMCILRPQSCPGATMPIGNAGKGTPVGHIHAPI